MELFEYWWLESQQDDSPENKKDVARAAWEAAKQLYGENASQPIPEPDLEELGFCLKCGTRPCTCEEKYGEEKAG